MAILKKFFTPYSLHAKTILQILLHSQNDSVAKYVVWRAAHQHGRSCTAIIRDLY